MSSIKEIAKLAGISIGTVDRALHNRGRVDPETRDRILKIADMLGYKPNPHARNLKLSKVYKFAVFMPLLEQDNAYWELPVKGVKRAQKELVNYKLDIQYFHYDKFSVDSIKTKFSEMKAWQPDGILLAPSDAVLLKKLLSLMESEVPVVLFDSIIPNFNYLSIIGQDSYKSGFLSAKLMHILLKDQAHIAVLRYFPSDDHINNRIAGFKEYFATIAGINISTFDVINNLNEVAENIFGPQNDIHGVFVSNASTFPIAKFVKSKFREKKIHIIGYDLLKENIKLLKEGYIDFLISQMPEKQGYDGINILFRHLVYKEKVAKENLLPIDILTKENIDFYKA